MDDLIRKRYILAHCCKEKEVQELGPSSWQAFA